MQVAVHVGCIVNSERLPETIIRSSRSELLYEINNWLFDYYRKSKSPVIQLPPLDDWSRSKEHSDTWVVPIGRDFVVSISQQSIKVST